MSKQKITHGKKLKGAAMAQWKAENPLSGTSGMDAIVEKIKKSVGENNVRVLENVIVFKADEAYLIEQAIDILKSHLVDAPKNPDTENIAIVDENGKMYFYQNRDVNTDLPNLAEHDFHWS